MEVHLAYPFVEGLGRPQVCNVESAEIGGSRLPKTGMPGVGLPFCQKWKATNGSPILHSYHRLDVFASLSIKSVIRMFVIANAHTRVGTQMTKHFIQ